MYTSNHRGHAEIALQVTYVICKGFFSMTTLSYDKFFALQSFVNRATTVDFWQKRSHSVCHIIGMPPMPPPRSIYQIQTKPRPRRLGGLASRGGPVNDGELTTIAK